MIADGLASASTGTPEGQQKFEALKRDIEALNSRLQSTLTVSVSAHRTTDRRMRSLTKLAPRMRRDWFTIIVIAIEIAILFAAVGGVYAAFHYY